MLTASKRICRFYPYLSYMHRIKYQSASLHPPLPFPSSSPSGVTKAMQSDTGDVLLYSLWSRCAFRTAHKYSLIAPTQRRWIYLIFCQFDLLFSLLNRPVLRRRYSERLQALWSEDHIPLTVKFCPPTQSVLGDPPSPLYDGY